MIHVDDVDDERLAGYADLTDREARRHIEAGLGVFVVEGLVALRALLASDYPVRSVLSSARRIDDVAAVTQGLQAPVYVARPEVLAAVAGFDVHRGVLALGGRRPASDPADLLARVAGAAGRLVVVTEGVNDHENLGALFRNAAALGAGAVRADPTTADPLYRRSIRVSAGHVLRLPFARLAPWPARLADLRQAGWFLLALTPQVDAPAIGPLVAGWDPVVPVALLVGAEGPGLTPAAQTAADQRVRIPLAPGVDSLNVATAAAIVLHELGQRGLGRAARGRATPRAGA